MPLWFHAASIAIFAASSRLQRCVFVSHDHGDAIHEWLDRYGIEISATDECELHKEIHHMLKNVEAKQVL